MVVSAHSGAGLNSSAEVMLGVDAWRRLRQAESTELEYFEALLWKIYRGEGTLEPVDQKQSDRFFFTANLTPAYAQVVVRASWVIVDLGIGLDASVKGSYLDRAADEDPAQSAVSWVPAHTEASLKDGAISMVAKRDKLLMANSATIEHLKDAVRSYKDSEAQSLKRVEELERQAEEVEDAHRLARVDAHSNLERAHARIAELEHLLKTLVGPKRRGVRRVLAWVFNPWGKH